MSVERDQEFVEFIIKAIVNNPDGVTVTRTVDELGVLLSVKVHKDDMGLIVGRSGATAKAIRTLARIVGMRNNARVNLRIEEPEGGRMSGQAGTGAEAASTGSIEPGRPLQYANSPKEKTVDEVMENLGTF